MRAADAQRAPSFSQSLRAMPYRDRSGYLRAIVVSAVAVVILVVVGVNALRQRSDAPPIAQRPVATVQPAVQSQAPVIVAAAPPTKTQGTRRPKAAKAAASSVPSISTWKSPTEALLKTPGDDLRTTLPKIGYTPAKSSTSE